MDLTNGELQYVVGSGMIELDHGTVAVVIASKKVPNAVEVKKIEGTYCVPAIHASSQCVC